MKITSALIIDQPWISKILNGEKDWEMRSGQCHKRGYIGLIEKGTGTVVAVAKLTNATGPLSDREMLDSVHRHGISKDMLSSGKYDKWRYAWQLQYVKKLPSPVSYQHKNGAVKWVDLDLKAQTEIESLLNNPATRIKSAQARNKEQAITDLTLSQQNKLPTPAPSVEINHTLAVSQGNINHNHIYLRSIKSLFPEDAIGGSNKKQLARKNIIVHFDKADTIETDIAGDKMIFRKRTGVKDFFAKNNIQPDDRIIISRLAPYEFRISRA